MSKRKKTDSFLPHEWPVRKISKIVHKFSDNLIPMKHYIGSQGKVVEFEDKEEILKLI